jgi:hypothetical protein
MVVFLKAQFLFVYRYIGIFILIVSVLVGSVGKAKIYRRIVTCPLRLLTCICLTARLLRMTLRVAPSMRVAPSDRDVRTQTAASRNVDLETRYVIVCVGACCERGGGREIIK